MVILYFEGQSTNLSTIRRVDSQLDQQLMHTPRARCEVLAILLEDSGVLLLDQSTMKNMAPLSGYQAKNTNILKVLRISQEHGEIISCFTSNIDEVHPHFNEVNANRTALLKVTESVYMEFLPKVKFAQVLHKLAVSSKSAPTSLPPVIHS